MVVAALLVGFIAALSALAFVTPKWYVPPVRTADATEADADRAESLERRVLSTLSDAHPFGTSWTLTLSAEDAAAWLNHRLPEWLRNHSVAAPVPGWNDAGPAAAVHVSTRLARVGVSARLSGRQTIAWVQLPLPLHAVMAPGVSRGTSHRWAFGVGSMTLPRFVVRAVAPDAVRLIDEALDHTTGNEHRTEAVAVIRLGDGRRVLLTRVEGEQGTLTLTFRTEGKAAGRRAR